MKALMPPYEPVACDYVVDELHRKFREKFPDNMVELEVFLFTALQSIEVVPTPDEETDAELKIRDVKDRPLACALFQTFLISSETVRLFLSMASVISCCIFSS